MAPPLWSARAFFDGPAHCSTSQICEVSLLCSEKLRRFSQARTFFALYLRRWCLVLRNIPLAHDSAPVDFPCHDPAYVAPTLPLPASASTSALPRPPLAYMAPTSPLPASASTSAVATAPHALSSERTDVLPRPAFAYPAPTSPLPASAPAFERHFLPLHGLRLPPGAAYSASLLPPPVLVPGAFGIASPAVTFADTASAAETAAALLYLLALP